MVWGQLSPIAPSGSWLLAPPLRCKCVSCFATMPGDGNTIHWPRQPLGGSQWACTCACTWPGLCTQRLAGNSLFGTTASTAMCIHIYMHMFVSLRFAWVQTVKPQHAWSQGDLRESLLEESVTECPIKRCVVTEIALYMSTLLDCSATSLWWMAPSQTLAPTAND